jgi:hypothetical protein
MAPAAKRLQRLRHEQPSITFLAFDSALSLAKVRLTALRNLVSHLRRLDFWILLVDTDSNVSKLVGKDEAKFDSRLESSLQNCLRVVPPFVALRKDVFLQVEPTKTQYLDLVGGKVSATHMQWLCFIPKMGRPSWNSVSWTRFWNPKGAIFIGIPLEPILEKMIGFHSVRYLTTVFEANTRAKLLVLANQRLPLNVIGNRGGYARLAHERQ